MIDSIDLFYQTLRSELLSVFHKLGLSSQRLTHCSNETKEFAKSTFFNQDIVGLTT